MRFRFLHIIMIILSASTNINAQVDVNRIKADPNYKWGEGTGATFEDADNEALAAMSRSIWTVIVSGSSQTGTSTFTDGEVSSENKQSIFLKSFTLNTIPNAHVVELSPEPDCRVFRYVHVDDINSLKLAKEKQVLDYIETGKRAEKRLQIDDALRCYYWALMLAKASIDPIEVENDGSKIDAKVYLPSKIKSVISNIKSELVDCQENNQNYYAKLKFTYNGYETASLQVWYNDGQRYVGPVSVRDGYGEFDLVSLPANMKIPLRYEYRFKEEAVNHGAELQAVFENVKPLALNASVDVPVKVNKKDGAIVAAGTGTVPLTTDKDIKIAPEEVRIKERMQMNMITDAAAYRSALNVIEQAISVGNPTIAKELFDESFEGYNMFVTLLTKTGKVSLVGKNQDYEFVEGNGLVLARFCNVKIQFNGRSFMEKLVFRFLPTGKIESLAMALTRKAEDDIFNAALTWPAVSKFTIQRFMEDYQTAYALKRLDFIESIFSDNALIITGSVLAPTKGLYNEENFSFGKSNNVRYTKQNKQQYLQRLKQHFNSREYIHLSFEDNITGMINTQGVLKDGAAFGIQIKQIYTSPVYSDRGYLSLFLNMQGQYPIIEVRFWQPEGEEMISFNDFQNTFQVK